MRRRGQHGQHSQERGVQAKKSGLRVLSLVVVLALLGAACDASFGGTRTSSAVSSALSPGPRSIMVAVDGVGVGDEGFNPHLVSDLSEVTLSVASLTLPSPFRPASDSQAPGGVVWHVDHSFVESAEVVGHAPFTVRYRVRDEAQWSDGAPIVAEDFQYLWRQMTAQPGVVDPADYGLVDDITSGRGGKEVTVVFRDECPRWQELFTNLLPAHVVRDDLGGFARAFVNGITVAGGSFRVDQIDRGKQEVVLVRNDRYWDAPAWADKIVLRRVGSGAQVASALRAKEAQLALVHGSQTVLAQLQAIPQVRAQVLTGRRALGLTLNIRDQRMADEGTRGALLGVLDSGLLAQVGAQNDVIVPASELSPRERLTPAQTIGALERRGYLLQPASGPPAGGGGTTAPAGGPAASSAGGAPVPPPVLSKDSRPFAMTIGVAQNDERALAVAGTVADQWRSAGVLAHVAQFPPEELYGAALRDDKVQAVVGWSAAGGALAVELSSRFGCVPEVGQLAAPVGPHGVRNLSGLCLPEFGPDLAEALSGRSSAEELASRIAVRFASSAVGLPILQEADILAVGPGLQGFDFNAPPTAGPMAGAASWELSS